MDGDIDEAEAAAFVGELIDAQLLVSDLELQVTGPEPLDTLMGRLPTGPVAAALAEVRSLLGKVDAGGPGAPAADYHRVATLLDDLPAPAERGRLLQVDMMKPAVAASLGPAVVRELARAIEVLHGLWRPPDHEDDLARFRHAFAIRFEDREVPLVEALDEELGVGFGSSPIEDTSAPLLAGLDFPPEPPEPAPWRAADELLLTRLHVALRDGDHELRLDDDDLAALGRSTAADRPPLPDAVEVIATLVASSAAAVDGGQFRLLVHGVSGPPGARLLGRFCHADDTLHRLVVDHLRQEEACRPEAAFAEIAHLPEGRLGNILCRPVLRSYEIPFLAGPGVAPDAQLPITDLLVSVRGGRVVLRSRRLDREVLPRLTTAHNFGYRTLGLYRFLGALAAQGVASSLRWTWGPLAGAPFLPRVTAGRLVLARAQWTLRGDELTDLPRDRLPRLVVLTDGDNQLLCDLDEPMSVDALRHQLKGRDQATLVELLPGPDELCVTGPEGRFVHELVVPFVRTPDRSSPPRDSHPTTRIPSPTVRRRFPPGSEWLYAKLFTGTASADGVLVDAVRPLVDGCLADGLADSWFFVRYGDDGWHVRLRLHGDAAAMLPRLHDAMAPLLADGRVWRVQLDTYEREVERYGGDAGMQLSETVFRHDSDAVTDLLALTVGDEGLDARWRLALVGTDRLLDDLGFTLAEKLEWADARRREFGAEFRADAGLHRQLGRRYRAERAVPRGPARRAAGDGGRPPLPARPRRPGPPVAGAGRPRRRAAPAGAPPRRPGRQLRPHARQPAPAQRPPGPGAGDPRPALPPVPGSAAPWLTSSGTRRWSTTPAGGRRATCCGWPPGGRRGCSGLVLALRARRRGGGVGRAGRRRAADHGAPRRWLGGSRGSSRWSWPTAARPAWPWSWPSTAATSP